MDGATTRPCSLAGQSDSGPLALVSAVGSPYPLRARGSMLMSMEQVLLALVGTLVPLATVLMSHRQPSSAALWPEGDLDAIPRPVGSGSRLLASAGGS